MVSPGLSSVPASSEPIMTQLAPAAMALVMSPEYLMPPSAMTGTLAVAGGASGFGDRRDLRNAGAGHDARGADGAGTDADLDGVGSGARQLAGAVKGAHVAGDQIDFRQLRLDQLDGFDHARRMAVRAVDGEQVTLWPSPSPARAPESRRWRRWPRPRAGGHASSLAALGYFSRF